MRVDWIVGARDNLFGRYIKFQSDFTVLGLLPLYGKVAPIYGQNLALEETHTFRPTLINTFKLGFNRDYFVGGSVATSTNVAAAVGLQNVAVNLPSSLYAVPEFRISGYGDFGHLLTFREILATLTSTLMSSTWYMGAIP